MQNAFQQQYQQLPLEDATLGIKLLTENSCKHFSVLRLQFLVNPNNKIAINVQCQNVIVNSQISCCQNVPVSQQSVRPGSV